MGCRVWWPGTLLPRCVTLNASPAMLRDQTDFACKKNYNVGEWNHVAHCKIFYIIIIPSNLDRCFSQSGKIVCLTKLGSQIYFETNLEYWSLRFVCLFEEKIYRALNFSFMYNSKKKKICRANGHRSLLFIILGKVSCSLTMTRIRIRATRC